MGSHDAYGKEVLRAAAGAAFADRGTSLEVDYGAGHPARVDGTVSGTIAVEVESRTSKQVRGAVLDLLFHAYPKKLLVLVPMHMFDCDACAAQCRHALGRFVDRDNFRVAVLQGTGTTPSVDADTQLVRAVLNELGFRTDGNDPASRGASPHQTEVNMPARRPDFDAALERILTTAAAAGQPSVVVKAGELHSEVGGYPGQDHRMPLCCKTIKDAMRPGDVILQSPRSGHGATLTVQYRLPRS